MKKTLAVVLTLLVVVGLMASCSPKKPDFTAYGYGFAGKAEDWETLQLITKNSMLMAPAGFLDALYSEDSSEMSENTVVAMAFTDTSKKYQSMEDAFPDTGIFDETLDQADVHVSSEINGNARGVYTYHGNQFDETIKTIYLLLEKATEYLSQPDESSFPIL